MTPPPSTSSPLAFASLRVGDRTDLLFVAVGQRLLELLASMEEAAHDRSFRNAHGLSHLFITESFNLSHDDDAAVVGR